MTVETMERRAYSLADIEIREVSGRSVVFGYAAVFDVEAEVFPDMFELVERGAFAQTLRSKDEVLALAHHDVTKILGRSTEGSLELRTDSKGLFAEITLADTTLGRDMLEDVRAKNLKGMSFGFEVRKAPFTNRNGHDLRLLRDLNLREVSIVTNPQWDDTSIAVRSRDAWRSQNRLATETRIRRLRLAEAGR